MILGSCVVNPSPLWTPGTVPCTFPAHLQHVSIPRWEVCIHPMKSALQSAGITAQLPLNKLLFRTHSSPLPWQQENLCGACFLAPGQPWSMNCFTALPHPIWFSAWREFWEPPIWVRKHRSVIDQQCCAVEALPCSAPLPPAVPLLGSRLPPRQCERVSGTQVGVRGAALSSGFFRMLLVPEGDPWDHSVHRQGARACPS